MKTHKNMTNQEVASLLRAVAAAYEVKGENLFRIRAYDNAAESIEHASREIKDLCEENRLDDLPGVGPNIATHIKELFTTGKVKHFDSVFADFPPAMFELLDIPGVGPKTAYKLSKRLGISKAQGAVNRLRETAQKGLIRKIEGFGEESERDILKGIGEYERRENRMVLPEAAQLSQEVIEYMKHEKAVQRIDPLGSLRRRASTVGDVDLAVATNQPEKVIAHFVKFPKAKQILAAGENTARLIHWSGRQVDIKTQTPSRYGSLLQHFTGSKTHNIHLREIAIAKGLSLSEHGIKKKGKTLEFASEEEFYSALGMQWIPPELRENEGEIEQALKRKLPELVTREDIRGDLHLHTNYPWVSSHDSGANSMSEMIQKAFELGYEYVGVGDHNPSTSQYKQDALVNLVKKRTELVKKEKEAYENRSENRSIKVLNTLEVDILKDGKLAIADEALYFLDFAVVSVHSSMRMSKKAMTVRILKGLSHPKAKILGHPTGRLLNKREGYEVDWQTIFQFARDRKKCLEINAWSTRLDLPDTLVREAIKKGVKLVVNTDAHALEHMELMGFGVDVARRGWAKAENIINTLPFSQLASELLS